jgi:hypothetical protein
MPDERRQYMDPIKRMLDEFRASIRRCSASERAVYEALVEEAEGWKMRLDELEEEDEEESEE